MIDYEDLNTYQRKILRAALLDIFDAGEDDLDLVLSDAGLKSVNRIARTRGWETRLNETLMYLQKRPGNMTRLIGTLEESHFGETAEIQQLPRLLASVETDLVDAIEGQGRSVEDLARVAKAALTAKGVRAPTTILASKVQNAAYEKLVRKAEFHHLYLWSALFEDRGRSLCKISCPIGGETLSGTGVRIGPSQILTNFHVVRPIVQAGIDPETIRVSFDFAETEDGVSSRVEPLADDWRGADAPSGSITAPGPGDLDFAVLNLKSPRPEEIALPLTGIAPVPEAGSIVFVLHHPQGMTLRHSIGVVREGGDPMRLRYDANTLDGSSGGLVLNEMLEPVALHHAGVGSFGSGYNQGIPLGLIRDKIGVA